MLRLNRLSKTALIAIAALPIAVYGGPFVQTNLTSSVLGLAANTDLNLRNPWGFSASATSPYWISDQVTGLSTLYDANGVPQALVVTIPTSGAIPPQGPTGQVFNSTSAPTSFVLSNGTKSAFIFDTLGGTIAGWNGAAGTTAITMFISSNRAVYTGLALGSSGGNDFLYAADFSNAAIDVINASFSKVSLGGTFTDPTLPAGYVPYNIQNIGGLLYVEYAQVDPVTHQAAKGAGKGFVSVFDTAGNFQQRLISNGLLNAPWGVTLASAGFPVFPGALLVGNFGDGTINAYNPTTGALLGTITDASNNPIVNDGLWSIGFRTAGGFDPNVVYFTAGINDENDGLFGQIGAVPEPGTLVLVSLALAGLAVGRRFIGTGAGKISR